MKKLFFTATALLCLSACVTNPELSKGIPADITKSQRNTVIKAVTKNLKDPDSARFGKMAAAEFKEDKYLFVCGWVNAKNSFGGYTGDAPFMGMLVAEGRIFEIVGEISVRDSRQKAVIEVCRRKGVLFP